MAEQILPWYLDSLKFRFIHTHTLVFMVYGDSVGILVFILYKLYLLSPYTNPTPKPTPHRKLSAFLDLKKK